MRYPKDYFAIPNVDTDDVIFQYGLDIITPSKDARPGTVRDAQNWEIDTDGGYTTTPGYERFDGRAKPSAALYAILDYTLTGTIAVGDTVTGATSSATGVVIVKATSVALQTYLVITKVTGTFTAAENLQVSAVTQGTAVSAQRSSAGETGLLHAQFTNDAADNYRADIAAVPGSGSILGIAKLNDIRFAFRNNAGGTACAMYKSSASGWALVALGRELAFTSGGTTEIVAGNTITGATSGATAVLTRVMLQSGTWAAGTAAGKFIFASQTGTFQSENIDIGATPNLSTIAGDGSAITLLPGGRYEIIVNNFGGAAGSDRLYGADKVNRGFEFDGTIFCPINTGMTVDKPTHVVSFQNHLFFSFDGSAQHSGIGTPYSFSILSGAGELAVGDNITAFSEQPGATGNATLAICARNRINILYGTSSANWNLVEFRREVGVYEYTVQEFGMTLMFDDRGISTFDTVQAYGNFQHISVSRLIRPFLTQRRNLATGSCIIRNKSQYRLYFSDGYGIYCTTDNNKVIGFMPVLFPNPVTCIYSLELNDGTEEVLFGSSDGFVYEMEKGTSFDGASIQTWLITNFIHSKSYQINKTYKGARMEVSGSGYSSFDFTYELGYNQTHIPQAGTTTHITELSNVLWDTFTWDAFIWDGAVLSPTHAEMDGTAENVSLIYRNNSDYFNPITLSGAQMRLIYRRQLRY